VTEGKDTMSKTKDRHELMKEWMDRLGLQEWRIKLEVDVLPCEMKLNDVDGEVEYTESIKAAVIRILCEKCYGNFIIPFDFERILVHELLHLKFKLLEDAENELQNRIVHQLIDDMARALICAKRGTLKIELKDG